MLISELIFEYLFEITHQFIIISLSDNSFVTLYLVSNVDRVLLKVKKCLTTAFKHSFSWFLIGIILARGLCIGPWVELVIEIFDNVFYTLLNVLIFTFIFYFFRIYLFL